MTCWRGGTGCSRHRDTDRPTLRWPSRIFISSSSPSIASLPLHLSPHPPSCLPTYLFPSSTQPQYRLSSACNPHLQAAAAAQRASLVNVSKVGFVYRLRSLMPRTQANITASWSACTSGSERGSHTDCQKSYCINKRSSTCWMKHWSRCKLRLLSFSVDLKMFVNNSSKVEAFSFVEMDYVLWWEATHQLMDHVNYYFPG